jgi:hypothetical protein
MKRIAFLLMVIVFFASIISTASAQTPSTSPNIKVTPVATLDYLNKTRTMNKGAVQGIKNTDSVAISTVKFVKEVVVAFPIAADTIFIGQGSNTWQAGKQDTIFFGLTPATATNPFVIPVGRVLDSTYYFTRTSKGSKLHTIYRSIPY